MQCLNYVRIFLLKQNLSGVVCTVKRFAMLNNITVLINAEIIVNVSFC